MITRLQVKRRCWTWLIVSSVAVFGCDRESHVYDRVDEPASVPPEVDLELPESSDASDEEEGDLASTCPRGTGRQESGECKKLATRDAGYVQRVQLPAGTFVMGDIPDAYDASPSRESPAIRWSGQPPRLADVESFWIDLHEVTGKAYDACVDAGDCTPASCDENDPSTEFSQDVLAAIPKTCVTHEQAEAFCAAHGGRLPTEVEWEYAARGVDARIFPWGNDLRDELGASLFPVGGVVSDQSYFGIRGMGSNANEWVADEYDPEAALDGFVSKDFRKPRGPLAKAKNERGGHVVKSARAGARVRATGADPRRGFRCAADPKPDDERLTVPAEPPNVPLVVNAGAIDLFGGVAEAVDRDEARTFCRVLSVEFGERTFDDWRLPTLAEVQAIASMFRGPGPFWVADGAAVQQSTGGRPTPQDPWVAEDAESIEALAARCVRDVEP